MPSKRHHRGIRAEQQSVLDPLHGRDVVLYVWRSHVRLSCVMGTSQPALRKQAAKLAVNLSAIFESPPSPRMVGHSTSPCAPPQAVLIKSAGKGDSGFS